MSVIEVTPDYTLDTSNESSADETRLRVDGRSTQGFDVLFDSDPSSAAALGPAAVALGVPARFDLYPGENWLFADERHAIRTDPFRCKVTITYTSVEDPLNAPSEYSWDFVVSQEPIDRDNADAPILNSADEPIDPPITDDVYDLVLRYRDNLADFDPTIASAYIGAVNSDTFLAFTAGKVKCTKYSGTPARAAANVTLLPGGLYFVRELLFVFRDDTWTRKFLDEGYRIKTGTDGSGNPTYEVVTDDKGMPLALPIKLDGSGGKLAAAGSPVFNEYDLKKTAVFANIGVVL